MCLKHLVTFNRGKALLDNFSKKKTLEAPSPNVVFREISLTPSAYSWVPSTLPHSRVYLSRNRSI